MSALKPDVDSTHDLGTTTLRWRKLWVDSIATTDEIAIGGNLTITGNLQVDGSTTTINSTTLTVDDKNIVVASGAQNDADWNGAGLTVDGANATFLYTDNGLISQWELNDDLELTGNLLPAANSNHNLGSTSLGWDNVYLGDSGVLQFGNDQDVTLTHVADNGIRLNGAMKLEFRDATEFLHSDVDGSMTLEGGVSVKLSVNTDTVLTAGANSVDIAQQLNVDDVTVSTSSTTGALVVDGGMGLAGDAHFGGDLSLQHDAVVLHFGADDDVSLTHVADTGLLLNGSSQLQFGAAATNIHQSAAGQLDLAASSALALTAPVVDIDASTAVRVSNDLELDSDSAVLKFGADKEVTLTHQHNEGLLLNGTNKLMFGSTGSYVQEAVAGEIAMSGSSATTSALSLSTSNPAGGIDIDAGTGGVDVETTGAFSIDGAAASNITVASGEANEDLTISVTGATASSLILSSAGTGADAVDINASAGGIDIDANGVLALDGAGGIDIGKNADVAIDVDASTFDLDASGALTLTSTSMTLDPSLTFDLDAAGAITIDGSSLSVGSDNDTGAITLKSTEANATIQTATSGKVHLNSAGLVDIDGATGITLDAAANDISLDAAAGSVTIEGAEAAGDAIHLNASNVAGGIDIDSGSAGVDLDTSGLVSLTTTLDAVKAVEVVASAGGIDILATGAAGDDIDILATGSSVNISSTESDASAIHLNASNAAGGINIDAGSAGVDLDTSGQVALTSSQAAANAVVINASDAAGGIDLSVQGEVVVSVDADSVDIAQDVNITGTTPTLTIGDAGAEDASIIFDGNAVDFHIGLDDSEDKLQIGLGSSLGTTPNMTLNSADRDVIFAGDIEVQGGRVTLSNGAIIDSETAGELTLTETLVKTSGNLTVAGNLTVSGTTTTVDSTTMTVADPLIKLNKGDTNAPVRDQGIVFSRSAGGVADRANQVLLWDESADQFAFVASATEDATTSGNVTIDSYAGLKVGSLEASSFTNSGLTNDQVVLAGVGGALEGSASFTFDGSDLQLANNIGLVFSTDDAEKIESDGTDLTINSGGDINLTASSDVNIPSGVGVTFGDDGEKIEGDGTDLTIASSNKLNLTATSDVHIPANVGLVFSTADAAEKIESNDTDLTINSGGDINLTASSDVNVPANVGMTFGDDGEKIEGDGTDLTIASSGKLNLTATSDVHIPVNVGLVLDGATGHEKIESDGTDISFSVGVGGDINIPENIGLVFSTDDAEKIESDGTNLTVTSGGNIVLDATSAVLPGADSADDLGEVGTAWRKLYVDDIDLNGQGRIDLDADADTSIRASADDVISFEVGGSDELHLNATELYPEANDGLTLGTAAKSFADLYLADAGAVRFQDNVSAADITLSHVRDAGLALKNLNTTDAGGAVLTLQTGDTDIALNDVLGSIEFQAPDEGTGTSSREVAAAISAISEGDFASDSNATKLSFKTSGSGAASGAALEKMSLSSTGVLTLSEGGIVIPDSATIGSASDTDAITINSAGDIAISSTTVSTSSTTGALKVAGGLGVADDLYVGGDIAVTGGLFTSNTVIRNATLSVQDGTETDTFSVTAAGAVSCDSTMTVGGNLTAESNLTVDGNATIDGNTVMKGKLFTQKITAGGAVTLGDHYIYLVNADNQTIALPSAATAGARYVIKQTAAFTNGTTIDANGAQTIDGSETVTLGSQYAFIEIVSHGTAWHIIGQGGTVTLN